MGFLSRIFGRKEQEVNERTAMQTNALLQGDAARSSQEQQLAALMGIKREMIHDDFLEGATELDALTVSGIDSEGKALNGGTPTIETNLESLSVRAMMSNRILTSVLSPQEAEIQKSNARLNVLRIEANMEKDSYEMGGITALQAYLMIIEVGLESAKEGLMLRALNSINETRQYNVQTTDIQQKKKGIFG